MSDTPKHETVFDVGAEQLGKTYAVALLGAAQQAGATDDVLRQLDEIVDEVLVAHPSLRETFASPRVSEQEKARVIDRLFGDTLHPTLIRFMKVMVGRGRLGYLAAVRDAAVGLHDETLGRVVADVRTAMPLSDELREEVSRRLGETMGKQVRLREQVDESLIGGMVIRVGDTVFDSSVSGRLEKLGRAASRGFSHQLLAHAERFTSGA